LHIGKKGLTDSESSRKSNVPYENILFSHLHLNLLCFFFPFFFTLLCDAVFIFFLLLFNENKPVAFMYSVLFMLFVFFCLFIFVFYTEYKSKTKIGVNGYFLNVANSEFLERISGSEMRQSIPNK
jgi:hypothetical protein